MSNPDYLEAGYVWAPYVPVVVTTITYETCDDEGYPLYDVIIDGVNHSNPSRIERSLGSTRKLKSGWSADLAQDLRAYNSLCELDAVMKVLDETEKAP